MHIIVANAKGGSGKSTIAVHLASYFALKGESVALADHDPQRSALDWLKARPLGCGEIHAVAAYKRQPIPEQCSRVIHDMPAGCEAEELVAMLGAGDKLLIPILPSPTDIKAGIRFLMALGRAGIVGDNSQQVGLVAERVRANTIYYRTLVDFLEQVDIPLVGTIRETQNYIRSMDRGLSIFDLPKSRVKIDVEQWQSILQWVTGENMVT